MFDTEITFVDGVSVTLHSPEPLTGTQKALLERMTSKDFYARANLKITPEIEEQIARGNSRQIKVDPVITRGVNHRLSRAEEKRERRKKRNLKHV